MKKPKEYNKPNCKMLPIGLKLNYGNWGNNEGYIGIGSGTIDAGMGQSKRHVIDFEEEEDTEYNNPWKE